MFQDGYYTLLKVHLVTGKSHQIRAHLKSIGHPIMETQNMATRMFTRFLEKSLDLDTSFCTHGDLSLEMMKKYLKNTGIRFLKRHCLMNF